MQMSIICPTAWNHIEACEPWSWLPGSTLMCMACASTWGHIDVCGLGSLQGPCLGLWSYCSKGPCSWSVLWSETKWKPLICALAHCEEQGGCCCHGICHCRYPIEKIHGRLLWPSPPTTHKGNSLHRKPLKRILKICVLEIPKNSSPQLMASGGGVRGEILHYI